MQKKFIGRKNELQKLDALSQQNQSNIAVIKGRRRIGKSRLAEEFGKNKRFLAFTGLAPTDLITAQDERNTFAQQLTHQLSLPPMTFLDWNDAFLHLSHHLNSEKTVIFYKKLSL